MPFTSSYLLEHRWKKFNLVVGAKMELHMAEHRDYLKVLHCGLIMRSMQGQKFSSIIATIRKLLIDILMEKTKTVVSGIRLHNYFNTNSTLWRLASPRV